MRETEWMRQIQRTYSKEQVPFLVSALQQDELVWNAVLDSGISERLILRNAKDLSQWLPASIVLELLQEPLTVSELRSLPMLPIENRLQKMAVKQYEDALRESHSPVNLKEAGLIALALRERRRLKNSWSGLVQELLGWESDTQPNKIRQWLSVLVCLYGMVPDAGDLLRGLYSACNQDDAADWILHIMLANSLDQETLINRISAFLIDLGDGECSRWLRKLILLGQKELAGELAGALLLLRTKQTGEAPLSSGSRNKAAQIVDLQEKAALLSIAGSSEDAGVQWKRTRQEMEKWRDTIVIQDAENRRCVLSREEILALLEQFGGDSKNKWDLLLQLPVLPDTILESLKDENIPAILSLRVAVAKYGQEKTDENHNQVWKTVEEVKKLASSTGRVYDSALELDYYPNEILEQLLSLGLFTEAGDLVEVFLNERKNDSQILVAAAKAFQQTGEIESAILNAQKACLLKPDQADLWRYLGELNQNSGDWETAYEARKQVSVLEPRMGFDDWVSLAECALQTKRLESAIVAADSALELDSQNGSAHMIMGLAKLSEGDTEQGIEHLTTSTLVMPDQPQAWLKLAESYSISGQTQREFETLRSAALAVPESAEVNFQLATAYQNNNELSEALPFLKKAANLSPQVAEVAAKLGDTLFKLGYYPEAETVLQDARSKWPIDSQIAYLLAQTLIAQGRKNEAVKSLEVAVKSAEAPKEWFKQYADTLVGDNDLVFDREGKLDYARLVNAKQALEKVLDVDPEDQEAARLYAEVLLSKGEYEPALLVYQDLLEKMDSANTNVDWRVRSGFGKAALQLGKTEAALAAMQSAAQIQPNLPGVIELLAEAYRSASLPKESMQEAQRALKLNPNDPETLMWFARMALVLGDHEAAIQTLKCLTELRPEKSHFWVELAGLQVEVGRLEEAKRTLNLMLSHETVNLEDFKKASKIFLMIKDFKQAAFCLERAVLLDKSQDAELLFVLAGVEYLSAEYKSSLAHVQTCAEMKPDWPCLFVLESDILNQFARRQAAAACLDQALKLIESQPPLEYQEDALILSLPIEFLESVSKAEFAYLRKAEACFVEGDLVSGEGYLTQCLSINPQWFAVRLMLVEIKRSQILNEQADQLFLQMDDYANEQIADNDRRWWTELVCARAESQLLREDIQHAARFLQPALAYGPENPRVMAAQSRILAYRGETKSAEALFLSAERSRGQEFVSNKAIEWFDLHTPNLAMRLNSWQFWMAQAAEANRCWKKGIDWLSQLVIEQPQHFAGQFLLAKLILVTYEDRMLCQDFSCVRHAPDKNILNAEYEMAFDNAVEALGNVTHFEMVGELSSLGKAVLKPSAETLRHAVASMKNQPQESILVGMLRHQGNIAGALQVSMKLPETLRNSIQQALCYTESEPDTGIRILDKWVLAQPENPWATAAQAKLYAIANQPVKALEAITKALNVWADEPEWLAFAAQLLEQTGNEEQAISHWVRAVKLEPDKYDYRLSLANLFLEKHLPAKVLETLEPVQTEMSNEAELWSIYAKAYWQMRNFERALSCAQMAVKLEPGVGSHYLLAGQIAKQVGNHKLALELGVQAFSIERNDLGITLFVSQIYAANGEDEKALKVIEQSSAQVQQTITALFERARLIHRIHGAEVALPLLDELLARDSKNVEVIAMKAELLSESGDLKNAEKTALEALQIDPRQSRLNLLVGKIKHHVGQLDQAVQYLSEAIRQNVNEIEAYLELGTTYQERRELGKAIQIYQQAIRIAPDDYRSYFNAGLVLRESKDYLEAETMLRIAADLAPDNVNIRRQLGAIVALNLVHNSQEVSRNL